MEFTDTHGSVPIQSWCRAIESGAMQQARNLADHPAVFHHVSLMPDCHQGYGMPIGGVIACPEAIIPNAVGVDIGCGMCAVQLMVMLMVEKGNREGKMLMLMVMLKEAEMFALNPSTPEPLYSVAQ